MLVTAGIEERVAEDLSSFDTTELRQLYRKQGEFLYLDKFLPEKVLDRWLEDLEELKPLIHRNFIPRHKKGGSVSYGGIQSHGPSIDAVYHSPAMIEFYQQIVGATLKPCPDSDPHRCALYSYTEEGDHIGFHYDTSYYKDRRWTMLVGLKDESSSRLLCHLHTKSQGQAIEKLEIYVKPGALVLFNGDTVYHGVSPTKAGEERFIISMQYVTSGDMNPFLRLFSNLKDAFGYFGLKEVFLRSKATKPSARNAQLK